MLVHVCGPETELTDMSVDLTFSNSSAVIPQHILRLSLKNNKKEETGFLGLCFYHHFVRKNSEMMTLFI